jgi:hypothetical protein
VEKSKKIGEVDPKPAVKTTRIESPIHERIVPLNHHETFALETIHCARMRKGLEVYLMRFITNARHPANSPPPKIVVLKER